MLFRETLEIETGRPIYFKDIIEDAQCIVDKSDITEGLCHLHVIGNRAGLLVTKNERMLLEDFRKYYRKLFKKNEVYQSPPSYKDLRSILTKKETTLPVSNANIILGKGNTIFFWEFDRPQKRTVVITINGD